MSALGNKEDLKVGKIGYSLDTIASGQKGFCYFDSIRYEVLAGSDIRKWAEVLIITLAPQPTVTETLSVFPLSYLLAGGGFQTVGVNNPLPVTAASKAATTITITGTAIGNTLIVAPSPGKKIRVHYFSYSNAHAADADVGIRFGASGDIKHRHYLAASGGNYGANIIDGNCEGAVNETLFAYLTAAYVGGIYFNISYSEE